MTQDDPQLQEISDADIVCHSVLNPKHFPKPDCLELGILQFFSDGNAHPYHLSVNSKALCAVYPDEMHAFGFYLAQKFSERNRVNSRDYDETYIGFVKAGVANVQQILNEKEKHFLKIEHAPVEQDNDKGIRENRAHCNIVLKFPPELKKPVKAVRNWMVDRLEETFGKDVTSPPAA